VQYGVVGQTESGTDLVEALLKQLIDGAFVGQNVLLEDCHHVLLGQVSALLDVVDLKHNYRIMPHHGAMSRHSAMSQCHAVRQSMCQLDYQPTGCNDTYTHSSRPWFP
jgi:hypothetical protein